jgi:hypothetical protein
MGPLRIGHDRAAEVPNLLVPAMLEDAAGR